MYGIEWPLASLPSLIFGDILLLYRIFALSHYRFVMPTTICLDRSFVSSLGINLDSIFYVTRATFLRGKDSLISFEFSNLSYLSK